MKYTKDHTVRSTGMQGRGESLDYPTSVLSCLWCWLQLVDGYQGAFSLGVTTRRVLGQKSKMGRLWLRYAVSTCWSRWKGKGYRRGRGSAEGILH